MIIYFFYKHQNLQELILVHNQQIFYILQNLLKIPSYSKPYFTLVSTPQTPIILYLLLSTPNFLAFPIFKVSYAGILFRNVLGNSRFYQHFHNLPLIGKFCHEPKKYFFFNIYFTFTSLP